MSNEIRLFSSLTFSFILVFVCSDLAGVHMFVVHSTVMTLGIGMVIVWYVITLHNAGHSTFACFPRPTLHLCVDIAA